MNTNPNTSTLIAIGECPLPDSTLQQYLAAEHPVLKNILNIYNYRGTGTETDARHTRALIGEDKYEHYHWDTVVTNGRILLLIPRYKHPQGTKAPFGFHLPAEWFWCFHQIEEGQDCSPTTAPVPRVPDNDILTAAESLPGLEWINIQRVNFTTHERGKSKPGHRPPPEGVQFFRFNGGMGLCIATNNS
jgi:hypothetical protein